MEDTPGIINLKLDEILTNQNVILKMLHSVQENQAALDVNRNIDTNHIKQLIETLSAMTVDCVTNTQITSISFVLFFKIFFILFRSFFFKFINLYCHSFCSAFQLYEIDSRKMMLAFMEIVLSDSLLG